VISVTRTESAASATAAIEQLTALNRSRHDPEIDRQLVRLRHEAFEEIDRTVTEFVPPPSEREDGTAPPSTIAPSEVSARAIRRSILANGFLHVPRLVPEDVADRLVAGIDRALEAAEAFERAETVDGTVSWFEPFKPAAHYPAAMKRQVDRRPWVRESGGVWAADSPRMLFELFEAFAAVGLIELVTDYLGERPAIAVDKCTLRRVGVDTSTDWHQDGAFLGTGTIRTLNVWVALTRCGRDAPGLDVVPTRLDSVVETGTDGAKFTWAVGPGAVERAADVAPIRPEFEAGDVMFFDELLLHRTAVDARMTQPRYAIETWFFAPSAYPEQYVPLVV
jgi:hypothetical protein